MARAGTLLTAAFYRLGALGQTIYQGLGEQAFRLVIITCVVKNELLKQRSRTATLRAPACALRKSECFRWAQTWVPADARRRQKPCNINLKPTPLNP